MNQAEVFDYVPLGAREPVFRRAGVTPADVQTLHCYDGFSPQVLWTLERFGFCAPGEAADWIAGGRIELGGELPVNTSGGHLSEGHSNGWGRPSRSFASSAAGGSPPDPEPACRPVGDDARRLDHLWHRPA